MILRFSDCRRPLLFALLAALLVGCNGGQDANTAEGATPPGSAQAASAVAPEKSPNDRRGYRALVLDNGLEVLLISDPETDMAAAAMDVDSGSNSNPENFQGLAHFLEHMLFLGTEKYPEPGEYQEYISSHGGGHNAYTGFENTNYFFDIEQGYLEPALDRFSQFFIAPLFNPEYVDRERNAVHSEYQSNLQSDGRRSNSAFKQVMNQDHPMSLFSVGSLETLQSSDETSLRDALLRHYEENYSANIMSLAILGAESLDELEAMARQYFDAVPDRDVEPPSTDEPLFSDGQLPALMEYRPFRDSRSISYDFPIPVTDPHYRAKPTDYIANLIGHEGEGSLLSLLMERGWANGLSAGTSLSTDDNAMFSVNISLTETGVDRLDEISNLLFDYIALVREEGFHQWLYDEQAQMAELDFLFQESSQPIRYVSSLARRQQQYPAAEVLTAPYAYEDYDPGLIASYLDRLNPNNVFLTFTSQTVEPERTEPWFGGEYSYGPLDAQRVASWTGDGIDSALAIPEPNPFLPEDLEIEGETERRLEQLSLEQIIEKPELILDRDGTRLWFRHDDVYNTPRANFYAYAMTPLFSASVENAMLSSLVISLVNDKLNEYSYPARLAGVDYDISRRSRGFLLRLGGYNDKQRTLLTEVLETLVEADFRQDRFDIIKDEMRRMLENADKQMPYVRAYRQLQALISEPYWFEEERLAALAGITLEDVEAFVPRMLEDLRIEALYHGNVLEDEALAMMDTVTEYLDASASAEAPPYGTVVDLPTESRIVQHVPVEHEDSAIVIYQQAPDDSLETRARVELLGTILRSPFFDTLRTERQLGYVVNAGSMSILDVSGLAMYIESPSAEPLTLEENINEFLTAFEDDLTGMSQTMFDDIKAGMLTNMRQKPQRLSGLSGRYWSDIMIRHYDTDSVVEMADAVERVTKAEIEDYYRQYVSDPDAGRLVARSFGNGHQDARTRALEQMADDVIHVEETPASFREFKDGRDVFVYDPD